MSGEHVPDPGGLTEGAGTRGATGLTGEPGAPDTTDLTEEEPGALDTMDLTGEPGTRDTTDLAEEPGALDTPGRAPSRPGPPVPGPAAPHRGPSSDPADLPGAGFLASHPPYGTDAAPGTNPADLPGAGFLANHPPHGTDPAPGTGPTPSARSAAPGAVPFPSARGAHPSPRPLDALASTIEQLRRDLTLAQESADARALIGIATGILVERGQGGPAEAALHLERLAESARVPLLELAADIVNGAAGDHVAEALPVSAYPSPSASDTGTKPGTVLRLRAAETGSMTGDAQTAAQSLFEQALAPLGASALALWAAGRDGALILAGHAGFSRGEAERWRYVPPGVGTWSQQVLTERRPRWYGTLPPGTPGIGLRHGTDGARSILPAEVGGRILGVLEVCWPQPQPPLTTAATRQLDALADLCAHTLPGTDVSAESAGWPPDEQAGPLADLADGLLDPALVLLPLLDDRNEVVDFHIAYTNERFADLAGRSRAVLTGMRWLEAYPLSAHQGGLYEHLLRVHATGEPFRAGRMTLNSQVDEVPLVSVASVGVGRYGDSVLLSWRLEDEASRLASLLQHAQRLGRIGGFEENAVTGDILWNGQLFTLFGLPPSSSPVPLERLHHHAHDDDSVAIGRFLRTLLHHRHSASAAFRLRRADGVMRHIRIVAEPVTDPAGNILSVRGAYQDVSSQHWTEVALAATRDRLADSEEQSAARSRLALQLQQAIMPPTRDAVDTAGLLVAVRYRPAEEEHLVGGDWYDAVALPTGKVLLAVGDVAGHGIDAATGMVVLRNALRGLAATGAGPAQLLGWLNSVAHHLTEQVTATAICGVYDPQTRLLRWARAGHPPPVLVRDGAAAALPMPPGILLGAVGEAPYTENDLVLEPGDRLLMYTDGLIERRDRTVQESLEQLLSLAGTAPPELEKHLDRLLTHSRSDTDDDTCLIGIEVR
ncbi:transcription antitermination regulator [Streptomyces spiroverticillatus]|uniref:Transcription antitermination regulator n=1 Tax=Streptomyces finlayi TaxID=67296 RepID=A0A919C9C5_9ACTN|nr:SpoIIE family protein phosphatase [Streptomyces finlayi]GHA01995.1 transcription antitermination regulator [Streptomyces spiroverticillatus]GHC86236.1 transcription antitermination regulator [Streptomyces finlayi]